METVKGILVIMVLILLASTLLLFIQNRSLDSQVDEAKILANEIDMLLRLQGARCAVTSTQFARFADECLGPLLVRRHFKEDSFRQPNDYTGDPGYVVMKNVDGFVYDSAKFRFDFNREVAQMGCLVPGEVGKDVTCRFNLPKTCEDGDIIEVFYPLEENELLVFLKTC